MPPDGPPFRLETEIIGPLPIINHFLARTHIEEILAQRLDGNSTRSEYARCIGVLLRNILLAREPLYALQEWAAPYRPDLLGLPEGSVNGLTDDRIGRALDRLFDMDRASFLTETVVRVMRDFKIETMELHNDTTTVTFDGRYDTAKGGKVRGKTTLVITFGHNKDHRPDLKQLLWSLTVTADGAVPIHYKVYDGNTNDAPTHRETWDALRQLLGRPEFLYVGDSKLCSEGTLQYIDGQGGHFLTVLPRTRKEDKLFRDWMQSHEPTWTEVRRDEPAFIGGECNVWHMMESPIPASDGFRLVWIWSTRMADVDRDAREDIMARAIIRIEQLETRLRNPRTRYRRREAVAAAAERAIGDSAERWVDYELSEEEEISYRQDGKGRPGKNTQYKRQTRTRFHVGWIPKEKNIIFDARTDGMFPLLTNSKGPPLRKLLSAYKFQPKLEKRHEQFKTVYGVAPMLLKKPTRIEALLCVYFLALLVEALIERDLRKAMKTHGLETVPLYPENRACEAPTTDKLLHLFDAVRLHRLKDGDKEVQVFPPELDEKQRAFLGLLSVPVKAYIGLK